ncbi:SDR family oxidoreductase [Bradyrhizobium guangzhouense]|uniref:Nucleoside-diphosphate sugar epimerase n=1 Tax=Bradyrhizobium guangzhouense TaxID=1325095 RepID=A0AAE6CBM8_9BRAD|nr:SDR family oxidoreductase [Bradyrhizobium guangzhouense]QAU49931.1 nucleoside-diphosphate sugar epimerase [Bradyrhizobium guangzhouense]RXH11561.1 SDR family oxidoreductase [Bradyrhizobium guangzhouense]
MNRRTILVLGASGLIGRFVTDDLRAGGFRAVGVARSLSPAQTMSALDIELPILSLDAAALTRLLSEHEVDVVVNCLGVLQDGPGSDTNAVHRDFVARLLQAIADSGRAIRLVHISIPGSAEADRTAFATTKREAERLIAASAIPHAILRPGFVVAPSAYGGSAMLRALAALPLDLPAKEMATPFQPVAVEDISATIAWLTAREIDDASVRAVSWDLMQSEPVAMTGVIKQFRLAFGTAGWPHLAMPPFMLDLGARLGDFANMLGWMPPMRSTAIAELRRGVTGDPSAWSAATGIAPKTLTEAIGRHPATIQDVWFARLFLIKALIIASLVVFWLVSGFIALFVSYRAAAAILTAHNFPPALVDPVTTATSLMDMSIGVLIAFRRTAAIGLVAGIVASLGYMFGAAILTPDLWIEPLGALVKTGPAIVLMLVALLMLDNR